MKTHFFCLALLASACTTFGNPYEGAGETDVESYKKVPFPFASGTKLTVRQGAFGKSSHNEKGNQYNWDFEVPFGTPVLAVEDGEVIDVWTPPGGGGCDAKFASAAYNVKVQHADGTVAQYMHLEPKVAYGRKVKRGAVLGVTANNGWICYPHLHFGIYASAANLYDSPSRRTLPLRFDGATPDGLAREGVSYLVP